MPRIARFICVGVPHHVTQRGNRRGRVFFSDGDYLTYKLWLREYAVKHALEILAYCLMTNHVHLVVIPRIRDSMQLSLRYLHMRYAQRVNRTKGWKGHVWQGRYFSSALDEPYCWSAIRYVERNPVRAGMVRRAENYPWSSARAHCGLGEDRVLSADEQWRRRFQGVGDWSVWLAAGDDTQHLKTLREHASKGLPCGSQQFIETLEAEAGRQLQYRDRGRPWPSRAPADPFKGMRPL